MSEYCSKLGWHLLAVAVFVLAAGQASLARGNTFTVNSTADVVDKTLGDGKCETGRDAPGVAGTPECTLRAAVQESNALAGKHEITLPSGTYVLSQPTSCTFRTRAGNIYSETMTSLCMTGQMTINGTGASTTIIDGAQADRVAFVSFGAVVEIRGATIQNGFQQ